MRQHSRMQLACEARTVFESTWPSPPSFSEVVRFFSHYFASVYFTLPLGESSVSEDRVQY